MGIGSVLQSPKAWIYSSRHSGSLKAAWRVREGRGLARRSEKGRQRQVSSRRPQGTRKEARKQVSRRSGTAATHLTRSTLSANSNSRTRRSSTGPRPPLRTAACTRPSGQPALLPSRRLSGPSLLSSSRLPGLCDCDDPTPAWLLTRLSTPPHASRLSASSWPNPNMTCKQ